jgi:Fis family transcriptional regulator
MKNDEDSSADLPGGSAESGQEPFGQSMVGENQTLRDSIEAALDNYFTHLDGQMASDLYNMVLAEVEQPLLEAVLRYTRNNQTRASTILGLNRGTLRKKLKQYDLL